MPVFSLIYQAIVLTSISLANARQFTVHNNCKYTVWPAVFTDLNVGKSVPDAPTGWEAESGSSRVFHVPDDWKSGRIWGRRDCDFSKDPGPGSCKSGGCNGGLLCDPHTGTGVPPATLAEWTFGSGDSPDYYDVSLVDGFNIPMAITNSKSSKGCKVADCPADLGPECPEALQGTKNSTGVNISCKSACGIDKNPGDSPSCCSGSHNTPATCPPSGVPYYEYFKKGCPNSYVYAYDESSGKALYTCPATEKADYTLTFCP